MLSAVAARKAAKAPATSSTITGNTSGQKSQSSTSSSSPKQRSKRASQLQKTRLNTKKARKLKPFEQPNGTKFADDLFKSQTDVIPVEMEYDEMSMSEDLLDVAETEAKVLHGSASSEDESMSEDSRMDVATLFPQLSQAAQHSEDNRQLTTWEPIADLNLFFLDRDESHALGLAGPTTLVCFREEESLCVLGTCQIAIVIGAVELCGLVLQEGPHQYPIFAPRSAPLPVFRQRSSTTPNRTFRDLPARVNGIANFKTVIAIWESVTGVEGLGKVCKNFGGIFEPSRWQQSVAHRPFGIDGLFMITRCARDLSPFTLPSSWSNAIHNATEVKDDAKSPAFFVKGPKNSGKSTLCRTMVNQLLQKYGRVAYLDCDIGQTEFTPPGVVSLTVVSRPIFGPPFTHPTLPRHAHFVGTTTPRSSPSQYLDSISSLLQSYQLDIQTPIYDLDNAADSRILHTIPLVVNTMGWIKGLGADLNQRIENLVAPTHVFDFQQPPIDSYPRYSAIQDNYEFLSSYGARGSATNPSFSKPSSVLLDPITSVVSSLPSSGFTAADHRNLSMISYFYATFSKDTNADLFSDTPATTWNVSHPLCAIPPYEVDCAIAFDKVILTGAGSEDVVNEEIQRVLNGAIVGLISCEPGVLETTKDEGSGIPYTQKSSVPPPSASRCVGLALVRGVSQLFNSGSTLRQSKTLLHLITPAPVSYLQQARVVVKGDLELPVWGMLDFRSFEKYGTLGGEVAGVQGESVPYMQWGKAPDGVHGAEKRKVRRNLMRRGQM
ncbi:hypothetical protein CPB83DRAFT_849803 [Crepidotus variabilis]|uniref:Polynucleotide 5'-hydroxyl-kinase GRC3 n=1 Tax=Crepidotus variabilis TaxID=179855 RepID=A0A9P6JRJ8_9AGAR|nr:hypothetical protein CPB83DRAFT_849803 [Crepidotus variabilis]